MTAVRLPRTVAASPEQVRRAWLEPAMSAQASMLTSTTRNHVAPGRSDAPDRATTHPED